MNRFVKIMCIIACVLLLLGVCLFLIGFAQGGRFTSYGSMQNTETIDRTFDQQIRSVELDIEMAEVEILTGSQFSVYGENLPEGHFDAYVEDGVLVVRETTYQNHGDWWNFAVNHSISFGGYSPSVKITIPESFVAEDFSAYLGVGSVAAGRIEAQKVEIAVGAGTFKADSIIADSCYIECGVGDVRAAADILNSCTIDCGSGNVSMSLAGSSGRWNSAIDVGVGNVTFDGHSYSGIVSKNNTNPDADRQLEISCGIGNITVKFKEE